ncbi:MAG TPA: rhodanese-like domain-containing protein [Blastocatellia bacterium]|jgi:rhodanese-related sulfurtransferase|nr:rhodanese-like domain-containing protein [Blastocatellia bacterium]
MAKATQQELVDRVTAEEVMRWMDSGQAVVFVDSRNPQAWSQSKEKLPGAIRIPADEVGRHLSEIPKSAAGERYIVTYCT